MKFVFFLFAVVSSVCAQNAVNVPNYDRTFHARRYGAVPNDANDDKAGLQAAIDAAIAAGGGTVQLEAGTYKVAPLGTRIGLLTDGDYVLLRGVPESTEIEFTTATATNGQPFCGLAGYRYNTCTAPYTAAPILVDGIRFTTDSASTGSTTADECHDLIGVCHAPWARITRCGFEQVRYHAMEFNCSKNVYVGDCYTYGTGDIMGCLLQNDSLGSAGAIATGGSHTAATPVENILVERFIMRTGRTTQTDTAELSHSFYMLNHTSTSGIVRNIRVKDCRIVQHEPDGLAGGSERYTIALDVAALPSEATNITVEGCTFTGGLTGNSVPICFSQGSGSPASTARYRNLSALNNVINGGFLYPISAGSLSSATGPRTSITNAALASFGNITIEGNTVIVGLNGNDTNGARTPRGIIVGACQGATVRNNFYRVPASPTLGSEWTAGSDFVNTGAYGFYCDTVQGLTFENNLVEFAYPSATGSYNFSSFAFCAGAFEVSGLPSHYQITGNRSRGTGSVGSNLCSHFAELISTGTSGIPQWTRKTEPYCTGYWAGNVGTNDGTLVQTIGADYLYPLTNLTSQSSAVTAATAAAIGVHDWRPNAKQIGLIVKLYTGSTVPAGWQAMNGTTAVNTLSFDQQAHWNLLLALSATTTIPSDSGFYVKLDGR